MNNFAINSAEIGAGLNNAASSLKAAGNSLEEAFGILAAANSVIQDIDKASTAIRTISARISSSSTELQELGEDTTGILSTADLQREMNAFGVSITNANGELRSTYDILDDLSEVWGDLTSVEKAAIAEMLAGNRQQAVFFGTIENWQDARDAVKECGDAAGELQNAYATSMDSIQGKLNQLTASWQSFSANLLDSDLIKILVDTIKGIVQILDFIIKAFDGFIAKLALVGVSLIAVIAILKKFKSVIMKDVAAGTKLLTALFQKVGIAAKELGKALLSPATFITLAIEMFMLFKDKLNGLGGFIVGVCAIIAFAVASMFKKISKTANEFLTSNWIGWIILAVTGVIMAIKSLIDWLNNINSGSFEKLKEEAKSARDEWEKSKGAIKETEDALEDINKKIDEINAKEGITLVDSQQLEALNQEKARLTAELNSRKENEKNALKNAANKSANAINAFKSESDTKYNGWQTFFAALGGFAVGNIPGAIAAGFAEDKRQKDAMKSRQSVFDNIMNGREWKDLAESEQDKIREYITTIGNELDGLEYQFDNGEGLEGWQRVLNQELDDYFDLLTRYNIANKNYDIVWDSIFNRSKFKNAVDGFKDLANAWEISVEAIEAIESGDFEKIANLGLSDNQLKQMQEFITYLEDMGLYEKNDAKQTEELVNQLRELNTTTQKIIATDYITILDGISDKYDTIYDLTEEMKDSGIISSDTIRDLFKEMPSLAKELEDSGLLELGDDGYILKDNALNRWIEKQIKSYEDAVERAEKELDKIEKARSNGKASDKDVRQAEESLKNAKNQLDGLLTSINTLNKTNLMKGYEELLNKQSDNLNEQISKYKDIIDIRKQLLKTYESEINYQKSLQEKTKNVADLQTQLAISRFDTSASGKAKTRDLEQQLSSAKSELDSFTLEHAVQVITEELDNSYSEYEELIKSQTDSITEELESLKEKTTDYLAEMIKKLGGDVPTHHTGGFVGGTSTRSSSEEFAKLLKGELVVTQGQMYNFMRNTLPSLAGAGAGGAILNAPIISIECDNINEDSLPKLEEIVNQAANKVKDLIDGAFSSSGIKIFNGSII